MTAFRVTATTTATTLVIVALAVLRLLVGSLLQNEAAGMCDWVAKWLVVRAARLLPASQRARWEEEWLGHLASLPTPLSRLVWAAAIRVYAAPNQAWLLREPASRQVPWWRRRPRWRDGQPPWQRSSRRALVTSAVVVVGFVVWMELEVGGPQVSEAFSDIVQAAAPLAAAGACFHAARRTPYGFGRWWTASLRRSWCLLGAACLSWGLGQVVWTYFELVAKTDPFPSLADLGFLSTVPLLIAGVLAFPTPVGPAARLRTLLDGLLIAVSLLFLSWATVLGGAYQGAGSSGLEKAFALAYPLGDFCAATIALLMLVRGRGRGVAHLSLIATAILALAVSDSAFAYMTHTSIHTSSALVNTGWLVGWLLFRVAALRPAVSELRPSDDSAARSSP